MGFRPGPVVAKFHTHPQVNKEATLAVVGYILVSPPASLVQKYLHRSHTTHHLLKKQPAKLAAEPWGTIFLKIKQPLKSCVNMLRTLRSFVGQLMQSGYQVLQRHYRPTHNPTPPLSQEGLCKQKSPCYTIPRSVNSGCIKKGANFTDSDLSPSPQRKHSIHHPRMYKY